MIDGLVLAADASDLADGINSIWILVVSFLVFFMQPGFVLLEAGQVRSKNVATVAMKNMFDWSLGVLAFFVVGLGLANLTGALTSPAPVSVADSFSYVNAPGEWINWLFGAVFAMTAATIVSGAVAERIKFEAYVVYSVLLTMVIYPVVVGLVWQGGLLSADGYLGETIGAGYLDFAGGTVVHMVGGIAGLTAAAFLGPRQDRYDEDGNSNPLPGHSVLFAVLGTLFLAFGWYGFNVGTQAALSGEGAFLGEKLGRVAVTTTLAMGGGAVASSIVTAVFLGRPDPLFTANGLLAGLVAVTGAAVHVTWWGGLLLGVVGGGLVYPTFTWTVESLKIDDVCGVFAVHGSAGAIGVVLLPFFAVESGGWAFAGLDQLAMQAVGVVVIGVWTVGATLAVFFVLDSLIGVRVGSEVEPRGLDLAEHNVIAYPQFATDGGVTAADSTQWSSQGTQETEEATMWRGEEVSTTTAGGVLGGAGIEQFPEPVVVVDGENRVDRLNGRAARFFGVLQDDAVGEEPAWLVEESAGPLEASAEALEGGQELRNRTGTVTVEGETIPISVTATPIYGQDEVAGVLLTIRNIADEVVREERRQTVAEYRDKGITSHQEKLETLADGTLDIDAGVPEPPANTDALAALAEEFEQMDQQLLAIAANVEAIVGKLPDQSAELADSSDALSDSSTEVDAAAADIDDLTSEIEAELGTLSADASEASANVSELSASVEQISASASEIQRQSSEAVELTEQGVEGVRTAVSQIRSATEHSEAVVTEIDQLETKMDSVADIVTIIQDIAEQTNMLALNASIEAANADASGDGFAVVADEVKSLAEQTRDSADDIETIISEVQEQTDTVTETIREANDEIASGADAVETTVDLLGEIQGRIEETNHGVAEISDAVDRQATNTEAVSASMQDVESMTDKIDDLAARISTQAARQSDAIGEVAGLADRLNDIATDVHRNIDRYELEQNLRAH